jgi:tRNA modification GTPase
VAKHSALLQDYDTIAAIITPPGEGGLAAIRIAGRRSLSLFHKHFRPLSQERTKPAPFMMRYGYFVDKHGTVIDEVTAVFMPQGKSYTGLDQVEVFCHGGRTVVRHILDEIIASGARVAEPGEFTKLAFLSGRIDLTKAEAVAEVVSANTDYSYRAAKDHLLGSYSQHILSLREKIINIIAEVEASIDFPEEEIDPAESRRLIYMIDETIKQIDSLVSTYTGGRIIKEGYKITIGGRPNAGKSSLFNLLLRQERAIVTPTPGTTRDYLSEWIDLEGFAVNLIDTAGLRKGGGAIEKAGQKSAMKIISDSDLLLWIVDLSEKDWLAKWQADFNMVKRYANILIGNKIDLLSNYRSLIDDAKMTVSEARLPASKTSSSVLARSEATKQSLEAAKAARMRSPRSTAKGGVTRDDMEVMAEFQLVGPNSCSSDMRKSEPPGFRPTKLRRSKSPCGFRHLPRFDFVPISCLTGQGMTQLKKKIVQHINASMPDLTSGLVVTSARHQQKLQATLKNLRRAKTKMKQGESPELIAFDLRQSATAIDEITGKVYTEDILERIFSRFCIGK